MLEKQQKIVMPYMPGQNAELINEYQYADNIAIYFIEKENQLIKIFLRFYLFIHDREREAETQAEGEAGSMPGARCGTRSQVSRITPWAKGRRQTAEPLGLPSLLRFTFT